MSDSPDPDRARHGQLPLVEIARLVSLHRVGLGAAHALNNAFTAILGETSLLQGGHKEDPELQEACAVIRAEVERCARVTRALLGRRTPSGARSELDLVRMVRETGGLLRDTLSRRIELAIELPDDLVLIEASASGLETLILTVVQHLCELVPRAARVRIAVVVGAQAPQAALEIELASPDLAEDAESHVVDPLPGASLAERAALAAVRSLAADHGARLETWCAARQRAGVRLSFATLAPDA